MTPKVPRLWRDLLSARSLSPLSHMLASQGALLDLPLSTLSHKAGATQIWGIKSNEMGNPRPERSRS